MHRDELPIVEPCNADWEAMEPRDRARFCRACGIEVIDVSAYTESEACALARAPRTGRVCMSYIVRADGTLKLADTPDVPVRSLLRRGRELVVAASLAFAACSPAEGQRTAGTPPAVLPQKPSTMAEPDVRIAGGIQPMPQPPAVDAGTPDAGNASPPRDGDRREQGEVPDTRLRGRIPAHRGTSSPDEP